MKKTDSQPFLKEERQKTDASLIAERDKTNESISKAKRETELLTDKAVLKERTKADEKTNSTRIEADSSRDDERDAFGYSDRHEQKNSDGRLLEERRRADIAVELERTKVDVAIEKERELKNVVAIRVLEQERKLTDKNLSAERTRTDSEVQQATDLLSDEKTEHSKTKISLTTRDEFLAIVSHDLRNPIGAASSCAEMLLEDSTYKEMDSEIRHWLEFIKRNVDSSLRLIGDLLDMERVAQGKFDLKLEMNNVSEVIRESIESFAQTAAAKSILLRSMPSVNPGEVVCDRDRIKQVLANLISNALKFTPEGGSITVNANLTETELQISVRDTGPGIPEEKFEKIFERFAQLGTNDRRGLGLGLYISKMLIEAHEGKIWVQSKLKEGSTFYFSIPKSLKNNRDIR